MAVLKKSYISILILVLIAVNAVVLWTSRGSAQQTLRGEVGANAWFIPIQTLTVANDVYRLPLRQGGVIKSGFLSQRAISSGTTTVLVKNDASTTLVTASSTSTTTAAATINLATVAPGDTLHFNVTALGTGAADISLVLWVEVSSSLTMEVPVFQFGETFDGRTVNGEVRIPTIVKTSTGRLIAFSDVNTLDTGDEGPIGIVRKYSDDYGITWNRFATDYVIEDDGTWMYGNNTAICKGTRIWLWFNKQLITDDAINFQRGDSVDTRRVMVTHSDDNGDTWAAPTEITADVKDPSFSWHACGPGNAMVTAAGRLVVPFNAYVPVTPPPTPIAHTGVFWSDDDGATWDVGAVTTAAGTESAVVELAGGNYLLNSRRDAQDGGMNNRVKWISTDGGATWGSQITTDEIVTVQCDGAMIKMPDNALIFSGPRSTGTRHSVTIYRSTDNGANWGDGANPANGRVVSFGGVQAAYSDLHPITPWHVGLLWEKGSGPTSKLVYTVVPTSMLGG